MKEIKFESNYGPFKYEISAEIGEEVNASSEKLCMAGIANTAYRAVGSAVDKMLVGRGIVAEKTPRNEIPYSVETAVLIGEAAQGKLDEIVKKDGLPTLLYAPKGEHQYGESKPSKEAESLWTTVQSYPAAKFAGVLKKLGLGEDYDDAAGIKACHAFLIETKKAAALRAKAELGELSE